MKPFAYRFTAAPLECGELSLLGISLHEAMPCGLVHRRQGMGAYLLTFFHADVIARLHDQTHPCAASSLIVWGPDAPQHFGNPHAPWEYSWMTCDGPYIHRVLDALAIPLNEVISLPDTFPIDRFIHCAYREFSQYLNPDPVILRDELQTLFDEVKRYLTSTDTARQIPTWAIAIKQYLENHFAQPITVDAMAARVHLSPNYFMRKFKEIFGVSSIEYLIRIRLQIARELLLDENLQHCRHRRAHRLRQFQLLHRALPAPFRREPTGATPRSERRGDEAAAHGGTSLAGIGALAARRVACSHR